MQQRLRRNAADVEADAAERGVALDDHRVEAEIGGAERGGVAAGTGADARRCGIRCRPCGRWRRRARGRSTRVAGDGVTGVAWRGRSGVVAAAFGASAFAGAASRLPAGAERLRCQRRAFAFDDRDDAAFRQLVADLDLQLATSPATDDGTSIVALSDSSVTRPWSCLTVSPTRPATRSPARRRNRRCRAPSLRCVPCASPQQSITRRMSPSSCARYAVKRAAAAPSITRWS